MTKAIVWSKYQCTFCDQAKALLKSKGIEFEERKIGDGWTKEDLLEAVPTTRAVPQIFLNEEYVGGFQELEKEINRKYLMQITLKSNEVYTFKLNSGEELIAKVIQETGDFITVSEPVSIAPGQQGLQMIPSVFTADPKEDFKLNTNSIAIVAQTDDSIKVKYIEATTGIKVPDKKLILG